MDVCPYCFCTLSFVDPLGFEALYNIKLPTAKKEKYRYMSFDY